MMNRWWVGRKELIYWIRYRHQNTVIFLTLNFTVANPDMTNSSAQESPLWVSLVLHPTLQTQGTRKMAHMACADTVECTSISNLQNAFFKFHNTIDDAMIRQYKHLIRSLYHRHRCAAVLGFDMRGNLAYLASREARCTWCRLPDEHMVKKQPTSPHTCT
jgi:hypothetical protein